LITWAEQYAKKASFEFHDERDLESLKSDESKVVVFENDDYEELTVVSIFKSLQFEFPPMGGKPSGYQYQKCKDMIKWMGLKPKHYVPLIDAMFNSFVSSLPEKNKK